MIKDRFRIKIIEKTIKRIMINDLKISLAGWYLGICAGTHDDEISWEQPELKAIMDKYDITRDDVLNAIPKEWLKELVNNE